MGSSDLSLRDRLRAMMREADAFAREDEGDDGDFYRSPRLDDRLDAQALHTLERLIEVVSPKQPEVLDLMAGADSHLPRRLRPKRVVGIGLSENELAANAHLDEHRIQNLNDDPDLPFEDDSFDLVLLTLSVQYLVHPVVLLREANRVMRPDGMLLIVFSNRTVAPKAVNLWMRLSEPERLGLVKLFLEEAGGFGDAEHFISMGQPRPADDPHSDTGMPSDPIFAVFAAKGETAEIRLRADQIHSGPRMPDPETVHVRKQTFVHTGLCPYCNEPMRLWEVTRNPMSTFSHDFYICVNDSCPYLVRGWKVMYDQGNPGMSYRACFDPVSRAFTPISIPSLNAIKSQVSDKTYTEGLEGPGKTREGT